MRISRRLCAIAFLVGWQSSGPAQTSPSTPAPQPSLLPGVGEPLAPRSPLPIPVAPSRISGEAGDAWGPGKASPITDSVPQAAVNSGEASATPATVSSSCEACTPADTFWTRPTLTGDWCGLRPRLKENGITFEGNLTQFGFGVGGGVYRLPPGGPLPLQLGDTFEYTGRGDYAFTFDLEKFGGMPNGKLLVRAQNWFGNYGNVSLNTGSFPPPIFASAIPPVPNDPGVPYITDFVVTQPLSKTLVVFAGKKNVLGAADQDDFAGGNGVSQFMNQAFVANPAFLLALPYTSFTAGVVSPQKWGSIGAFVYDPQDRTKDFFRLDDLFSQGVIVGTEVKVKTNFLSKPGEQHLGGLWKHVELSNLAFNEPPPGVYPYTAVPGSPTLWDSYTIYYGFDQYLHMYSGDSKKGLGIFGRASISDGNPTPIRYFLSLGIGGNSPFRTQKGDTFGIGWYYTGLSQEFGPVPQAVFAPRDGYGIELFYNIQVTPWMNLTPDFQIIKPEAGALANMAYIGGVRLNLKF